LTPNCCNRQVDATAQAVFTDVADDVGELQRLAQFVRIHRGLRLRLAKDVGRHFAHHTSHEMAVALQAGVVEVAGLGQVHLAALDHRLQVALLDGVVSRQRHQRLHHRVAGLAGKCLGHFGLPPGQLGCGHAGIDHVIHHIIDFTAKGVKRGDRGAPGFGQKQEGVIKAAARGGGFLLDIVLRGHGAIVTSHCGIITSTGRATA
jgi:hypothetical protein